MDPVEFRLKNASEEGDPQATGRPFNRIGLRQVLERVKESDHWRSRPEGPNRGRGMATGYWFGARFTSSAHITINPDGTASLTLGSVDITGTRTSMQQIAAEELGLRAEDVSVATGDTESVGYTDVSGGSRITYTMGTAVYRACQDAIEQLRARAARKFQTTVDNIEYCDGKFLVKDEPGKVATLKDLAIGPEGAVVGRGTVSGMRMAAGFSAGVVDVEVDPETGKVKILRYTVFDDAGKAINPTRIEAQMQGGVTQAIGWALTEEYRYDEKGVLLNANLLDYRQPVAADLPYIDTEIVEVPAAEGPYGVRGVGEPPIVNPMAAIANAIHSATGVRMTHAPMTPERVLMALKGRK
jgi:CO/xanthine dehydrogenase Mo-binding subunit